MHQFSHLHVAQMRYALGQLTVVVKQIPLTFYFNNRVVVSPAQNPLQNNTTVGERPVRVVASGVGNKVRVASRVGEVVSIIILVHLGRLEIPSANLGGSQLL